MSREYSDEENKEPVLEEEVEESLAVEEATQTKPKKPEGMCFYCALENNHLGFAWMDEVIGGQPAPFYNQKLSL